MAATTLDLLARRVADLERRMNSLGGSAPGSGNTTQYGPNVLGNAMIESGSSGYFVLAELGYTFPAVPVITVETVAPLDGVRSLKISEGASGAGWIGDCPSGNTAAPTVGADVFSCASGQTWLISALMSASVATAHAQLIGVTGATAPDALQLSGGGTTWTTAADIPLDANTPTLMQGTIVVPSTNSSFISVAFVAAGGAGPQPGSAWSWLLDNVSLQQKLI